MNELANRINSQRKILEIINDRKWLSEPLLGLTENSLKRWLERNSLSSESELSKLLFLVSEKLFFLANKSQEQITEEYILLSEEIDSIIFPIKMTIEKT